MNSVRIGGVAAGLALTGNKSGDAIYVAVVSFQKSINQKHESDAKEKKSLRRWPSASWRERILGKPVRKRGLTLIMQRSTTTCFAVILSILAAATLFGQSPRATCHANYLNGVLTGDVCDLAISPAPAAGSVIVYWVSGTIDPVSGNVVPWALPLDFHGWTTLEYSGPTVGSITYGGATIYTRPLP